MPSSAATLPLRADYQALVETGLPLALRIARHLASSASSLERFEADDLYQVGCEALLGIVRRYDGDRGASFTTYAAHRLRGAMVDHIRTQRWGKRNPNRRGDVVHGRPPVSLHEPAFQETSSRRFGEQDLRIDQIAGPEEDPLADSLTDVDRAELQARISRLDDRLQFVVHQHLAGQPLRAIGDRLGVTESRASQLLTKAKHRLGVATDPRDLSCRELQVLSYIAVGLNMPQTAKIMGLAVETIKTHCSHIRAKLGAATITHAVAIAMRSELICQHPAEEAAP